MSHLNLLTTPIELDPPLAYIIIRKSQHCFCGALHEFSELYYERTAPSRLGTPKRLKNLHRIDGNRTSIEYKLPVRCISMALERIPFCHECFQDTPALAQLPPPPLPEPRTPLNPFTPESTPATKEPSSRKKASTIADVLDLL